MSPARLHTSVLGALLAIATIGATPALAQLNGENLLGDTGVKNASQPAPGFYIGYLYYRFRTDTIKGPDGEPIVFDPSQRGSQSIDVGAPLIMYVSQKKLFGGNIGMMAVVPFANGGLEAPAFGLNEQVSTDIADMYIVPFQLGWHQPKADVTAGFGMFAPTGSYEPGASDNLGKGMWSFEVFGGGTMYLDEKRSVSLATTAYWESHTKKDGTTDLEFAGLTPTGIRVGQLLTLEGGAAKSFLHGAAHLGVAYYAQWKITRDDLGLPALPGMPDIGKHKVFGIGPDVTIPIATSSRLISLINIRYFWEFGAETKTQGQSLFVTTTFPVPGIKIAPAR